MITFKHCLFAIAATGVTGCSGAIPEPKAQMPTQTAAPKPQATPLPAPKAVATPAPKVVAQKGAWTDWPIATGKWRYEDGGRATVASFGNDAANPVVRLWCDTQDKKIMFYVRSDAQSNSPQTLVLRASEGMKSFPVTPGNDRLLFYGASIPPADTMLDMISFSRGRFAVELGQIKSAAFPTGSEFSRVVEDCR